MGKEDFERLKQSIREHGAILRGELKPSRSYTLVDLIGKERAALVMARHASGLTQAKFANIIGVSPRTLEQWEQGRRTPTGSARILIQLMADQPKVVLEAVAKMKTVRETRVSPTVIIPNAKRGRPTGARK